MPEGEAPVYAMGIRSLEYLPLVVERRLMRVRVDADVCTGHGRCYALAPDVFAPDDFGHCEIVVAGGEVPEALEAQARTGAASCPELAISLAA